MFLIVGRAGRRARPACDRPRPVGRVGAWDRAITDFALAWKLSPEERTALYLTLRTPMRRLDTLVRELLAEAAGLAMETGRAELAAWCYATCERITNDPSARPKWDEVAIERSLLEPLGAAAAHGIAREALMWWCVRLVPRLAAETPEHARQRTTVCALYLSVMVVQAFTADDAPSRARAGLVAALGTVVARQSRALLGAA
jgi:hypothetical protein